MNTTNFTFGRPPRRGLARPISVPSGHAHPQAEWNHRTRVGGTVTVPLDRWLKAGKGHRTMLDPVTAGTSTPDPYKLSGSPATDSSGGAVASPRSL